MDGFHKLTQEALIRRVGEAGDFSDAAAHPALVAVLAELGGALTWGEAQNLAGQLPPPLAAGIRARAVEPGVSRYSPESFVRLVAEDLGVTPEVGRERVRAVLEALRDQLRPDRFHALTEELPTFGPLLADR